MVNHPNRKRTPFQVNAYPGDMLGRFPSAINAQRIAQMWSERWHSWAEVFDTRDQTIIGQYDHGMPTPEFRGRGDEAYPGSNVIGVAVTNGQPGDTP